MYEQKMCATADKIYIPDKSVINTRTTIAPDTFVYRELLFFAEFWLKQWGFLVFAFTKST